ncbi:MAG TPA: serine hydrolase [Streptosporangiaceae bacterium]|nr:serine hydrolase [Streptosporangiaceae bacterium]
MMQPGAGPGPAAAAQATAAPAGASRGLMAGPPPFPPGSRVTLANWQDPPFNRWAFQHVRELIPTARIPRGDGPAWPLRRAERDLGGVRFTSAGQEMTIAELLAQSCTDGFLVLHRGRIVAEQYFNGMAPDTPHLLMSVSKSVTAAVAGVLAGRGQLDVSAPVTAVVPELAGTSFGGCTVQHLLDMRAGTAFNEDYADPEADVRTYERVYLWRPPDGRPVPEDAIAYFATLRNDGPHGGPFRYRSILTDVLAWVIERAAGARFHELVSRLLWRPMGAEFDAEITVDAHGNPMADGGICATLRDAGRFGELYLRRGRRARREVVPAAWVHDTIRGAPDGAQAYLGGDDPSAYPARSHYRNCWWVDDPGLPFYYASGINGQHIFVHVPSQTVVVKLSTWPTALSPWLEATILGVHAIAAALQRRG